VFFTVAFLVPGFIWASVFHLFLRRRADRPNVTALRFLTLSAFNYAVWSWLIYLLSTQAGVLARPWAAALAWFVILFVSPVVLGASTGLLSQRAVVQRLFARYGDHTVHAVPTAWDYVFSYAPKSWVLVTLTDGSAVAGVFNTGSLASSDSSERDLFLERLYRVGDDGSWHPVPASRGVWIRGDAIRAIEFTEFRE
jgi:hypothetical protein